MGSITQTVASIVGPSQVTPWEAVADSLRGSVQRAIADSTPPAGVVYPQTVDELAAVVACAYQHRWRLLPCGAGSKLDWGSLTQNIDLVLSTARLTQGIDHAEGDLTVTAPAGVVFSQLQDSLLSTRQFLAIDPAYPDQATLGGIVATRDTGAYRQRYGGIRDMLIGLSFVRYDGERAKAGGRVVKNVAGYDLMKLMSGSFGTLGILTELTFRTYPLSETAQTVQLVGAIDAIRAVTAAILLSSLTPVKMDLLSPGLRSDTDAENLGLVLQFQSIAAGVAEQIERLRTIAQPYDVAVKDLPAADNEPLWVAINQTLYPLMDKDTVAIAKVGILPAQAVNLLEFLGHQLPATAWQARIHASSGLGTLRIDCNQVTIEQLQDVRSRCQANQGYLTLLKAPTQWKTTVDSWGASPASRLLMSRLQEKFDPHQQLSPGRMG